MNEQLLLNHFGGVESVRIFNSLSRTEKEQLISILLNVKGEGGETDEVDEVDAADEDYANNASHLNHAHHAYHAYHAEGGEDPDEMEIREDREQQREETSRGANHGANPFSPPTHTKRKPPREQHGSSNGNNSTYNMRRKTKGVASLSFPSEQPTDDYYDDVEGASTDGGPSNAACSAAPPTHGEHIRRDPPSGNAKETNEKEASMSSNKQKGKIKKNNASSRGGNSSNEKKKKKNLHATSSNVSSLASVLITNRGRNYYGGVLPFYMFEGNKERIPAWEYDYHMGGDIPRSYFTRRNSTANDATCSELATYQFSRSDRMHSDQHDGRPATRFRGNLTSYSDLERHSLLSGSRSRSRGRGRSGLFGGYHTDRAPRRKLAHVGNAATATAAVATIATTAATPGNPLDGANPKEQMHTSERAPFGAPPPEEPKRNDEKETTPSGSNPSQQTQAYPKGTNTKRNHHHLEKLLHLIRSSPHMRTDKEQAKQINSILSEFANSLNTERDLNQSTTTTADDSQMCMFNGGQEFTQDATQRRNNNVSRRKDPDYSLGPLINNVCDGGRVMGETTGGLVEDGAAHPGMMERGAAHTGIMESVATHTGVIQNGPAWRSFDHHRGGEDNPSCFTGDGQEAQRGTSVAPGVAPLVNADQTNEAHVMGRHMNMAGYLGDWGNSSSADAANGGNVVNTGNAAIPPNLPGEDGRSKRNNYQLAPVEGLHSAYDADLNHLSNSLMGTQATYSIIKYNLTKNNLINNVLSDMKSNLSQNNLMKTSSGCAYPGAMEDAKDVSFYHSKKRRKL